ncbi:S-adenosyl-L-methionine-dependent methyltransferase [Cantharellus anzutake]|uniref:S-adenosyl-L-methionine-dependent methyltransferase n=1 Tax=Cantharellus anzutake TaxID=1750568 RepID=UPI0019066C80|nr:S-adenosyl-L-methionine-dependent methyltransferase [Cantharellus anzutake]KAF8306274.1 S-adenosyl-L-methionine-dependent methyltransferase [Cantharellus anzutake]
MGPIIRLAEAVTEVDIIQGPRLISQILIIFFVSAPNLFWGLNIMNEDEELWGDPGPSDHRGSMVSMVHPKTTNNTSVHHDEADSEDGGSEGSVHPYESETDEARFFIVRDGRRYNDTSQLYPLPAGEEEWDRLADLHKIHKICLGSLYQASTTVENLLADEEGEEKRILDCGCGGGEWVIEMGLKFPHAKVVGVDLAPGSIRDQMPTNCRFEFDDVNKPLNHLYGKFDVVHAKSCFLGIANYQHFLNEMAQCLKPGGIVLIVESPLRLMVPAMASANSVFVGNWLARMFEVVENSIQGNGLDTIAIDSLQTLMEGHPQLENEESFVVNIPVGPWTMAETQYLGEASEFIGGLMQENVVRLVQALRNVLLQAGHHPRLADEWLTSVTQAITSPSARLISTWKYFCATRVADMDVHLDAGAEEGEEEGEEDEEEDEEDEEGEEDEDEEDEEGEGDEEEEEMLRRGQCLEWVRRHSTSGIPNRP